MKLGPHVIIPTAAALRWAEHAPVVKAIDTVLPFERAPDRALRIFRHYFTSEEQRTLSGYELAQHIIAALGRYRHPRLVVELINEPSITNATEAQALLERTRHATRVLHSAGLKVAGFSFSTGAPGDLALWDVLRAGDYAGVDYVALHEYWGNQGFTPWHALRHRLVHERTQGDHPPFLITECGRDAVEGGGAGWQLSGISAAWYLSELEQYAELLDADGYVHGATVFTAGPTDDWWAFDVDGLVDGLVHLTEHWSIGGTAMDYVPRDVWNAYWRSLGAPGYNPETALGKARDAHPEWGVPISGERRWVLPDGSAIITQFFAAGVAYVREGDWENVGFAATLEELPKF